MQGNKKHFFMRKLLALLWSMFLVAAAQAGSPMWTFEPLTATTVAVPVNDAAVVQYRVTNQSSKPRILTLQPIQGTRQITTGLNACGNPFVLESKSSCVLSVQIIGSQLNSPITDGPMVCPQGSPNQCYRPGAASILRITQAPPTATAAITVAGTPLTLTIGDPAGQLTINNISMQLTATNITSNFMGTALDGNVTETGNTCANVPPGGSCTLTYTPGSMIVPQTNFTIQGTNTNVLTAAIAIQSGSTLTAIWPVSGTASGGVGFYLTGTGLTGATDVTFGGSAATSVNVLNSTTVTGVTPARAAGVVDVVISTPAGGATLTNGYTYESTAVGQDSNGGRIACLGGGTNNLIADTIFRAGMPWGPDGLIGASSNTDGALNTSVIVAVPGTYAAKVCNDYEVDSLGRTPCEAGNTCYNDWFMPAIDQLNCLFTNRADIGGFSLGYYMSSTEFSSTEAWDIDFSDGTRKSWFGKTWNGPKLRCVRAFTP